jgi:hypothetical protein
VTQKLEEVVGKLKKKGVAFHGSIIEDEHVRLACNSLYLVEVLHAGAYCPAP